MSFEKVCRKSDETFLIAEDDLLFYQRISPVFDGEAQPLPPPTLAPAQRAVRRLAWRNSNHLYRRRCDKTGETTISAYPENAPFPIYSPAVWWGDSWDQLASGLALDLTRPFFEQFRELQRRAPRPALMNRESENSDYCHYAGRNKNCYMANNGSWFNENCQFGESYLRSRDSVDCGYLYTSELCYEVMGGTNLYECAYVLDCYHSVNCFFSLNLRGCTDCFLCSNLRNKSQHIFNRPATKQEIADLRASMKTRSGRDALLAKFAVLRSESVHPSAHLTNCEDSTGDYLTNCKNVQLSFIVGNVRDGKYLLHVDEGTDMWDCSLAGYDGSELYYESISSGAGGSRVLFCSTSWTSSDVLYCDTVMSCNNCFGCIGLKRQEYCILNRQYSKAEYEATIPKLIAHMRATGEWGEFFPAELAPHAYNESHAADFYPLTAAQAQNLGFRWREEAEATHHTEYAVVPEDIDAVTEDHCKILFRCKQTGLPYRLVQPELQLLRKLGIAPPEFSPETRRKKRSGLRNTPRFFNRECCTCSERILTTHSEATAAKVCCRDCYMELI